MSRQGQTKYEKGKEILETIKELENSISPDALVLIKKIYKEICAEMGVYNIAFYSDQLIVDRIIKVAYKYEFDEILLEYFTRTITMICRRFEINTKTSYDFLIRHIELRNKRIQLVIANQLPLLLEFDNYKNKWEYILSIPKIAPKKYSIDIFLWTIKHRLNDVPNNLKENIAEIMENHINKSNIITYDTTTYELYLDIINKLKNNN